MLVQASKSASTLEPVPDLFEADVADLTVEQSNSTRGVDGVQSASDVTVAWAETASMLEPHGFSHGSLTRYQKPTRSARDELVKTATR